MEWDKQGGFIIREGLSCQKIHSWIILLAKVMKRLRCLERFPIVIETHFWTRRRFFKQSARLVLAPNRSLRPASITLRVLKDITYCFVTSLRWYGWVFNTTTPIIHLSLEQWSGRIARTPSLTHAWLKPGRKSFVFLPGAPRWGKRHQTEPKSEVVPGLREPVWTPPPERSGLNPGESINTSLTWGATVSWNLNHAFYSSSFKALRAYFSQLASLLWVMWLHSKKQTPFCQS